MKRVSVGRLSETLGNRPHDPSDVRLKIIRTNTPVYGENFHLLFFFINVMPSKASNFL